MPDIIAQYLTIGALVSAMLMPTLVMALLLQGRGAAPPRPPARPTPASPAHTFFTTPLALADMLGKQAVVETTRGTFIVQLLPEVAPNHVGFFMAQAREGALVGTIFHRVIRNGMILGGDPVTKDAAKVAEYGSGGLNRLRAEAKTERPTAGAVVAVTVPGLPDSAGSQFMVLAGDQPAIAGQYTVFGRVVDGLEVIQDISAVDADANGLPRARVTITTISIRETPPVPFVKDTAAELATYKAIVDTTLGQFELEMLPDKAPETVRAFLRMAEAGVYDGIAVHRVAANFVIQTGALAFRDKPLLSRQQALVGNLPPEFTDTPNVPGIVSMARGADPNSGSTSFFVCTGSCRGLDNQYTVFARVIAGQSVIDAIAGVPVDGETPRRPIVMMKISVRKR